MAYSGIYQARSTKLNAGATLDAFVPQVFGDVPVKVTRFLGDFPLGTGMGWIFFQGGDPAFPVWCSGLGGVGGGGSVMDDEVFVGPSDPGTTQYELWYDTDATGGGSGSASLPAGGTTNQVLGKNSNTDFDTHWIDQTGGSGGAGTDDVWIGPTDPIATVPTIDLWYDTDAVAPMDDLRWYTAWGMVAYSAATTDQAAIGATESDLAGLSVTFTPVAGRRYRTTVSWLALLGTSGATNLVGTLTNEANVTLQQRNLSFPANAYFHMYLDLVESGLPAVSTTRKARAVTGAGTISPTAHATRPNFIVVEDVGPVTGATVVAPIPDEGRWFTAWGMVGVGTMPVPAGTVVPANTVTSVGTVTANLLVGRRYQISGAIRAVAPNGANGGARLTISGAGLPANDKWGVVDGNYLSMDVRVLYAPAASGSVTFSLDYQSNVSTFVYAEQAVSNFWIEDVGPVTGSTVIPSVAVTPWTNAPLVNGWANLSTPPWRGAQYRKVGDIVYLRGLISRVSPLTPITFLTIFTLPVGFRPLADEIFSVNVGGATGYGEYVGRCDVLQSGTVSVVIGVAAQNAHTYTSLAGVQFSVSS